MQINITEKGKKRDGFKGEKMFVLPTEDLQTYIEHPLVSQLYLTDVGFFPRARNHYRERQIGLEEYILIYCIEGNGTIHLKGKSYFLHKNEAFCIPRHFSHCYYANEKDPWSILWVHFKGSNVKYYPVDEMQVLHFSEDISITVISLFEMLFNALNGNYTLGNFIYISQIVSLILAQIYKREKSDSIFQQNKHMTGIIRYMYGHIHENLTLEDISNEFDLSKSYLNSIFRKYSKHAPMDFYINLKMKEACKLLQSTNLYIYEVAQKLGYEDQYYFSRIFKKVVGISPQKFKEKGSLYFKE